VRKSFRSSPLALAALAALTLGGLALRAGYAFEQPSPPPPDAGAYSRIAENLYRHGTFDTRPEGVGREAQPSSAYSPGLPLLVAGVYWLSGGVHLTLALLLLAAIGAAAIPMAFLLGRRFGGDLAGLVGAAALAVYPALLDYQGMLLTEPLAAFLLAAALVMYFNAAEIAPPPLLGGGEEESEMESPPPPRPGAAWSWLGTGFLLGLLVLVRPEYLLLALALPLVWLGREALRGRAMARTAAAPVAASLLATVVVLAPWTIHNAVSLGRFVPVSTGGGKALFIGTYLDADGDPVKLRELLLAERPALRARLAAGGPLDDPERFVLERVLARVAAERHPGLETDAALGRLGREDVEDDITDEPARFAGMLASKSYETWTDAARSVMLKEPWRALQLAIVLLSLAGLLVLALRRRRFEALIAGLTLLYMTAIGALLIASPRRELVVLPLLVALAGAAVAAGRDSLARRWAG
jgi:4-amino-4-deoxy-L-arabinose transferase-like glycosyltransferase